MMSDNASTYLSAAEELKKLFESPIPIEETLIRQNVQWQFIPKRAPYGRHAPCIKFLGSAAFGRD
jgi:hypothetical protein